MTKVDIRLRDNPTLLPIRDIGVGGSVVVMVVTLSNRLEEVKRDTGLHD